MARLAMKRALSRAVRRESVSEYLKMRRIEPGTPRHIAIGIAGEDIAVRYLADQGMKIVDRNVRVGRLEIDIIAKDGDELVFAEVRTRNANSVAAPEDTVGPSKLAKLVNAASLWTDFLNYDGFWRIDLVAVNVEGETASVEYFRDITEPML